MLSYFGGPVRGRSPPLLYMWTPSFHRIIYWKCYPVSYACSLHLYQKSVGYRKAHIDFSKIFILFFWFVCHVLWKYLGILISIALCILKSGTTVFFCSVLFTGDHFDHFSFQITYLKYCFCLFVCLKDPAFALPITKQNCQSGKPKTKSKQQKLFTRTMTLPEMNHSNLAGCFRRQVLRTKRHPKSSGVSTWFGTLEFHTLYRCKEKMKE